MNTTIPEKPYFRIGEVSKILRVDPYVVRYWESEFKSVKPIRTKSNHRLYRRKDVEELLLIKTLLYTDKFTIRGAKLHLSKSRGDVNVMRDDQDRHRQLLAEIKKGLREIRDMFN